MINTEIKFCTVVITFGYRMMAYMTHCIVHKFIAICDERTLIPIYITVSCEVYSGCEFVGMFRDLKLKNRYKFVFRN